MATKEDIINLIKSESSTEFKLDIIEIWLNTARLNGRSEVYQELTYQEIERAKA